jgi:DNA-binding NarL/FixJ family response regulator
VNAEDLTTIAAEANAALLAGARPANDVEAFVSAADYVAAPVSAADYVAAPVSAADYVAALAALSPRERTVFPLLAGGLSQREIAARCGVSVKTVETYRTRISHKLGLQNRAELIRFALEAGVLRPNGRN